MRNRSIVRLVFLLAVWVVASLLFSAPSRHRTMDFFAAHRDELEAFCSLAREEALFPHADPRELSEADRLLARPEDAQLRGISGSDELTGCLNGYAIFDDPFSRPVSPELQTAWDKCRHGYLTDIDLSFAGSGALWAHFSVEGSWQPYEEGNYCVAHCLIWQDDGCPDAAERHWMLLDSADGGSWYYTHHKHYDG